VSKRVAVLQPGYLPWLGFFDQMIRSDIFIIYDDVQYDRNGWRNRNRIKTPHGPLWLTVPVHVRGFPLIKDVRVNNTTAWGRKQLAGVQCNYARAPHYTEHVDELSRILLRKWEFLVDLDLEILAWLRRVLQIATPVRLSSEMGLQGDRIARLLEVCQMTGATHYLTGDAARSYLQEDLFASAGVCVEYQNYHHPVYQQLHGEFIPYLSVLDLILNCGPRSRGILGARSVDEEKGLCKL